MNKYRNFKVAALAASIALGMGSTAVMAAAPASTQLPGQGKVLTGPTPTVNIDTTTNTMTINLTGSNIIDWGAGTAPTDINNTGAAGFNLGSDATLTFGGTFAALNIDSTGNPSQIFGTITNDGNVFVANENGIIVGAGASIHSINGAVALIANTLDTTGFTGSVTTLFYNGTSTGSGDVTVQPGAIIKARNSNNVFLVAGAGTVNVDLGAVTGKARLWAGLSTGGVWASKNPLATLTVTGSALGNTVNMLNSAGTATTNGKLTVTTSAVEGLLTNNGDLTLPAVNGDVYNRGQLTSGMGAQFSSLRNDGSYAAAGFSVTGGDLTNNGTITGASSVFVTDGSIVNNGTMSDVASLFTRSDSDFTAGSAYSITNNGTINAPAGLVILANNAPGGGLKDDTTGSFINAGTLSVGALGSLNAYASGDISLGGALQVGDEANSAANPFGTVTMMADGVTTVSAPIVFDGAGSFYAAGSQVRLMNDISGVDGAGNAAGIANVFAGPAVMNDYAVRVAAGKTISAGMITVDGLHADDAPNVILQGTLSGNKLYLGNANYIGDLFSGPAGGLEAIGANPFVYLGFSGAVKTAKYNNSSNFRFNYLPINNAGDDSLDLMLNPAKFATNGTSNGLSAVNVLVNGDVDLLEGGTLGAVSPISGTGSAVTGVSTVPNTHLVVQSTGNISATAGYYWPGYVYLGNINMDADSNALPGTLGFGTISLKGDFSNVLPGDIAGASGIHLITQLPLDIGDKVTTNTNAWVNFGTELLTEAYASGTLAKGQFFGGTQGPGSVINYGALKAANFHTAPPSDVR